MAQVICNLPNASMLINGVKFIEHEAGVISEEISDDAAAAFLRIKGYIVAVEKVVDEDLVKLRSEAEAIGVKIKSTWSKERLSAEIARAKNKASAGDSQKAQA